MKGTFIRITPAIYRMVYLVWSAPITKFWVHQIFYILFLGTMNIAVLWPSCGNKQLDTLCVTWIFLIGVEIVDRTCRLYLTNANVPLFSKFVEFFVITFFGVSYMTSRLFEAGPFKDPYAGKVLVCVALLYFYYRQTLIYLPISPQVGPLLYSIKLMERSAAASARGKREQQPWGPSWDVVGSYWKRAIAVANQWSKDGC
ncbi:hypothetical protein MRX96_003000 [Rhipicephalus microplus]